MSIDISKSPFMHKAGAASFPKVALSAARVHGWFQRFNSSRVDDMV